MEDSLEFGEFENALVKLIVEEIDEKPERCEIWLNW